MPFDWAAAAGSVLGAGASIFGSNKAADAIEKANRQALRQQGVATQQSLALQQPFVSAGTNALGALSSLFGLPAPETQTTPGVPNGLSEVPGVFWQNRPVFQDASGALFASRGRDATVGSAGLELLGTPEANASKGVKLGGKFLRDSRGQRVRTSNGQLVSKQGEAFNPVARPDDQRTPSQVTSGGTSVSPKTGVSNGPSQSNNLLEALATTPGFQFRQQEGERAITRGAAARGLNESGGTLRELVDFNQGLAQTTVNENLLNPLFTLAGFGPTAVAGSQNAIQAGAANQGNLALNAGQARASAFQNQGNTLGNLVAGLPSFFNRNQPTSPFGGRALNGRPLQGPPLG